MILSMHSRRYAPVLYTGTINDIYGDLACMFFCHLIFKTVERYLLSTREVWSVVACLLSRLEFHFDSSLQIVWLSFALGEHTVQLSGTSSTTIAFAPMFTLLPIFMSPSSTAPEPIRTLSPMVGWPLPWCPIVTFWLTQRFSPTVSASTTHVHPCCTNTPYKSRGSRETEFHHFRHKPGYQQRRISEAHIEYIAEFSDTAHQIIKRSNILPSGRWSLTS